MRIDGFEAIRGKSKVSKAQMLFGGGRENMFSQKFVLGGSRPDAHRPRELNSRPGIPREGQARAI